MKFANAGFVLLLVGLVVAFVLGSDGGSAIINLAYSLDGGIEWVAFDPPRTTSPVTIAGLENGTTYAIALRAINAIGKGEPSEVVSETPITTPMMPSDLAAEAGTDEVIVTSLIGEGAENPVAVFEYSLDDGLIWTPFTSESSIPVPVAMLAASQLGDVQPLFLRHVQFRVPAALLGSAKNIIVRALNAVGISLQSSSAAAQPSC